MNYSDLPVADRIKMASEYALLLVEDNIMYEDMIKDLQERFSLTQNEALTALERTKNDFSSEYKSLANASIFRAVTSIVTSVIFGLFYLFVGDEIGYLVAIIGILFLCIGFMSCIVLVQKMMDKFFYSPTLIRARIKRSKNPKEDKQDFTVYLFVFTFCLCLLAVFNYFKKSGIINIETLATVPGLQIKEKVYKESTGGKSPTYYYVFHIYGHKNEFRFYQTYYHYAEPDFRADDFKPGDTISIQLKPEDFFEKINNYSNEGVVDIINIIKDSRPIIDLASRNKSEEADNMRNLKIVGIICGLALLIMILKHKYAAKGDRKQFYLEM